MIQSYRYGPTLGVWVDGRPQRAPFGFSSLSSVVDDIDALGGVDAEVVIGVLIAETWGRVLGCAGAILSASREDSTYECSIRLAESSMHFGFLDVGVAARAARVYADMQREIDQENET